MSIDARITAVTVIDPYGTSPKVRLKLEARERGGSAGQTALTIVNPPTVDPVALSGLIDTEIWGGSSEIMVGDRKWAKRIGYTEIELV